MFVNTHWGATFHFPLAGAVVINDSQLRAMTTYVIVALLFGLVFEQKVMSWRLKSEHKQATNKIWKTHRIREVRLLPSEGEEDSSMQGGQGKVIIGETGGHYVAVKISTNFDDGDLCPLPVSSQVLLLCCCCCCSSFLTDIVSR